MLTVHHLNNSRSQRVLWLLEELAFPTRSCAISASPDMRAPKELRAIHPLGKSPVVTDNGNTVAESGAIVEYLVATYGNGRLIPAPNSPERLRYTYWLHYAEGSAMSPLLLKLLFTLMPTAHAGIAAAAGAQGLQPGPDHAGQSAAQAAHGLLGRRTRQDRMVRRQGIFRRRHPDELSAGGRLGARRAGEGHPKAMAFLEKIHARPAYKRALEKGGPYEIGR